MKNEIEAHAILAIIFAVIGAFVAPVFFASAWYWGALLGFLVGVGIPLIGVFGIVD